MNLLYALTVLTISQSNLDFHEFDVSQYILFRDKLPKNHFLVTLAINNTQKYQFYKNLFINISSDISKYINGNINFSYILLIDPDLNNNYEAAFYIYLPGVSEKEVSIYPRLSIAFNTNKIINNCLTQIITLRSIEKEQKTPEITRITEELSEIAKIMKAPIDNCSSQNILINDYSLLADELMQYIPKNMQKERRLLLQQQILSENSFEYQRLEFEIQKEREMRLKSMIKDGNGLSPHKVDKMKQKYLIQILKSASDDLSIQVMKSAFTGIYNLFKK